MTDPSNQTASDSANDQSPAATGLGDVMRRCRRRTTDLLAIGLLLVVGLAVGRQLTAWWNEPELDSHPNPLAVTGSGSAWTEPQDLQLGELGQTIHRQQVSGDRQAAWTALEHSTRKTARQAGWPNSEADQPERQLLELLAQRKPHQNHTAANTAANTAASIHRLDGPLPMVVATRRLLGQTRVVGWGLATRRPDHGWVTWTFAAASHIDTLPVELPAGSRQLLAVGNEHSQRLLVFCGNPGPNDWWNHFDSQLNRSGWTAQAPPSRHADGWTARWQHPSGQALVVSARHDHSGRWHAMLNVFTPTRTGPTNPIPTRRAGQEST